MMVTIPKMAHDKMVVSGLKILKSPKDLFYK